jgi:hypothetical protein
MEWNGVRLLYVGNDWSEEHHDVEVQDEAGRVLARAKLPEGVAGMARLHAMIAEHLGDRVGPGTDRGRLSGLRDQPAADGPLPGAL